MTDLIFVSMEDWDEVWRRNQFVCEELARRDPARRILFVGLQRNLLRSLARGEWAALWRDPTWPVPGLPNVTVTTPLRVTPERFGWGRRFNEWLTRRHVRRAAAVLGLRAPVLWLNPHAAVHMLGRMGEEAAVYDITDDWEEMDQPPALKAAIHAQDAQLGTRADAVIVCSEALLAAKEKKFRRRVHLIPNGVDTEHYRAVADPGQPAPPLGRRWARPVLGYTGTLHPERVDVGLVVRLATILAHASIVLIGPNLLETAERKQLESCPNIYLVGAVPYRELPDWMRAFDVCIVPHRITAFTESLNPIKLWEYLAAGKPIVSTRVAGFRDYPGLVRLADGAEDFAYKIDAALTEPPALVEARRTEARGHSWRRRVDQIEAVIASCLTR